ncbi:MAG TPA: SAM-dependent methyltransferase, partial [Candidatus Sulfotelmatobacter sp.]
MRQFTRLVNDEAGLNCGGRLRAMADANDQLSNPAGEPQAKSLKTTRVAAREGAASAKPALYLVGTPIGNLQDITLRALRVLKEVDVIACEDTRQTQKLLNHFAIGTRTTSYHEHNELTRAAELVKEMQEGASVALVTDAGMPGISDPGFRLIALA